MARTSSTLPFAITRGRKKAIASSAVICAAALFPLAYMTNLDANAEEVKPESVDAVQACRIVFGESVPMFQALDKYLIEGGSQEARSAIADAADEYSEAPLDGISQVPSQILDPATNFYDQVSAIPTGDIRGNTISEDEQWDVVAPAGMAQEELFYQCATEGVYLDESYLIFYEEPLTDEDFVPFGM